MKYNPVILFTLALALALASPAARGAAVVGEAAPEFTLEDTHGESRSLSDFKEHYVVLEWLNHGCPFVKKHYDSGNMQALQKKYGEQDVVWLSICSSAPGKQGYFEPEEANRLTAEKKAMPAAVLRDPEGKVGRLYGAKVTPHIFIINPEGILVYQGAIDDTPSTKASDIPGSKNYVSATLDAALAGEPVERSSTKPYGCSVKYE